MSVHYNETRGKWFAVINYRRHDGTRAQVRRDAFRFTANELRDVASVEDFDRLAKGRDTGGQRDAERVERKLEALRDANALPSMVAPVPQPEPIQVLTVSDYLGYRDADGKWHDGIWLAGRRGIRGSTLIRYRHALAPVSERLGSIPVGTVTPIQIESVYDALRDNKKAEKTILNVHRVLKRALSDAVNKDVIMRNPADRVEAPRAPAAEIRVLTRDELDKIMTETDKTPIGPMIRLAAWTGLRLGEFLALRWDDLDLDGARLTVRRMLNNYGQIDEPKSRRSRRTITLSSGTVALLRDVKTAQDAEKDKLGRAYQDQDYVFADAVGNPRPQFSVNHIWRWAVKRAKVEHATIHGLRHAHASHLLADGWELSAVAERLGHSRTSITLDFYSHALPTRNAELAESIDRIFGIG